MLAPLVLVIDDVAHLERIKSRLAPLFPAKARAAGRGGGEDVAMLPQTSRYRC